MLGEKIKDHKITSENSFKTRRNLLKKLGVGSILLPSASLISYPAFSSLYTPVVNKSFIAKRPITA